MFEGIFKKFTCDNCDAEKFVKVWPRSWICLHRKGATIHYCFACQRSEEAAEMDKERERIKKYNPNARFVS
jgi:hypothetical protein